MSKKKKSNTSNNVWDNFSFKEGKQKSALDYLNELKTGLVEQTGGELILETEAVDAYDTNPMTIAAIYKLFVVAPKLGYFRRKILSVAEYSETGRFPVDIVNHFADDNIKHNKVAEIDFMTKITEILTSPIVKNSIENLFQQSKEYNKTK